MEFHLWSSSKVGNVSGCWERRHLTHQMHKVEEGFAPQRGRVWGAHPRPQKRLELCSLLLSLAQLQYPVTHVSAFSKHSDYLQLEWSGGKNRVRQTFILLGFEQWFWSCFQRKHSLFGHTVHPHVCSPASALPLFPSTLPHGIFEPIDWFQPHFKNLKVLMIIAIPLVVQKLAEKRDTNAFPCWGDGGQSSARAAAVQSAPTYWPMQLACTVPCVSYRAHSLLDIVELMEEAGLLRWQSMGGLRYKSGASQASLIWLHTLRKQLLFPKLSQYMEDVPLSLEKCYVPEKYQYHWKTQDMYSQSWVHWGKQRKS